jgi:hypothetical protein
VQGTLTEDLRTYSDNGVRISSSIIEEAVSCLSEVLKIMEFGVISENSASPVRDRCFFCLKRVKELRRMLLAVLEE